MPQLNQSTSNAFRRKVRHLNLFCGLIWLVATVMPVFAARSGLRIGSWPLDYWLAAQGSIISYVMIVVLHAWLINHWEKVNDVQPPGISDHQA